QQQGVTPDSLVALCINRSLDMLVALLGILTAGGAYLPIDAALPAERIKSLLQESGARLLLTQQALLAELSAITQGLDCQLIALDTHGEQIAQAQGALATTVTPANLAYVIYTSGSTGQPKGVMVEHRNVVNHNLAVIDAYQLTAEDRVLQFSTISFDIFVEEVFPTLLAGAAVVLMDGKHYTDVQYLKATINKQRVSLINLPTAYWHTLVEEQFDANHLKRVVIGGEKAEREKFNTWQQNNPTIAVINTYGPTETTVISLLYKIDPRLPPEQQIPLGTPLANTQVYVLDAYLNPVPVGVQGELHIAGGGVSRGYLHQPELTAEKFINNPFGTGQLYKSGDLVRWLADGNLDYIGRADDQVKIRGFRVELGEIERVLLKHAQVINAVVIAQKHARGTQLIAYYQAENKLDEADLRSYLRKLLPDYMLPSALLRLDEIPMTSNGKINRQLLQSKTIAIESTTPYVAPTNAIETALADIWQEVLGIQQVGIHDNFFALGGHSLLAIQIILRTNKNLSVNISLSTLFDAADIQQLAAIVAQSEQTEAGDTLAEFAEKSDELIF
ncbi:MAG: non-ribosomal peptide synthetase, partial [Methylococcaceae bacterium]|nr:non-ribosomal peptide synthetase [Methylococcaceae bacterium]